MGRLRLFGWCQWPLLLRLRRSDWICLDDELLSPAPLPAGWYVLSIRCPQADHAMLSIRPGQLCSLGRGQLRRRVLRLGRRQQLRLALAAPLHSGQIDRLDLLRIPGWRAWGLINRKLQRFQVLERGPSPRRRRWQRYNRLLARSGASRVSLAQWLRHLAHLGRRHPAMLCGTIPPAGWALLQAADLCLDPLVAGHLAAVCSHRHDLDLVHGDLLELSASGRPGRAVLLPIWDPELFRANPRCHGAWFVREAVLDRCRHALRSSGLPADDPWLRLELLHQLQHVRIGHLPQVLSTRQRPLQSVDVDEWEAVVRKWLRQRRPDLQVWREGDLGLRLDPLPSSASRFKDDPVRVSIIIPTRDRCDLLRQCLESIQALTLPLDHGKWEILIVDNGSRDPETLSYLQELEEQKITRVLRDPGAFNYSRLNNLAVRHSEGNVLLFLNNDTEVISEYWLQRLVAQAERAEIGAVGACLLFGDGTVQHGGVLLGIGGVAGHAHKYRSGQDEGDLLTLRLRRQYAAVTGAVLAVERNKFNAVGGFDEDGLAVNYNDVDLCLRLVSQGWQTLCCPDVRLFHHESRSRGAPTGMAYQQWQQERATMERRWGALMKNDPWYNPHFSRREENYSLRLLERLPGLRSLGGSESHA